MSDQPLPSAITRFFDALPTRDADTIGDCFTEDASYYFLIPGPAVTGRENLKTMFKGLGTMFSRVEWEIAKHGSLRSPRVASRDTERSRCYSADLRSTAY